MSGNKDYGYFGSGIDGYVHYMKTVEHTMNSNPTRKGSNRYSKNNTSQHHKLNIADIIVFAISIAGWMLFIYTTFFSQKS